MTDHDAHVEPGRLVAAGERLAGRQGLDYVVGISAETVGSRGLHMQLVTIPPGGRAFAHRHVAHETAIYALSGTSAVWHGAELEHHATVPPGSFFYIPANTPHLPYNPSATEPVVAVIARTDPNEQESVDLMPQLDGLRPRRGDPAVEGAPHGTSSSERSGETTGVQAMTDPRDASAKSATTRADPAVWDEHLMAEFQTRDVDAALSTMVDEPYVNHIPTMTGGTGRAELRRFYSDHFIGQWPADTSIMPISRTVGEERIVDEMLIAFTHDRVIDCLLPGIPATGRRIEIPTVAIVRLENGKVAAEHIYWDQASVLVQAGLIDPIGLPVAGSEVAAKLLDPTRPSNGLLVKETAGR